jgi:hypothetical protein
MKVLDRLLVSLAEADKGSRELDIIMSFVLGETSGEAGKMVELLVEEGYPWEIVSELLDHDLPSYTTSLDAALPDENIVLSVYSTRRRLWGAAHRTADGQHVMRWAATECLARRLAALSALAPPGTAETGKLTEAALSNAIDDDAAPPVTGQESGDIDGDEAAHDEAGDGEAGDGEEETEWKILF